MSEALTKTTSIAASIEQVLIGGDLSKLSVEQRLSYYKAVCESVGLNPLTKPFDYISLNGKLVLYAKRDATDQLRKIHGVSILNIESKTINDVFIVTAHAKDRDERQDSSTGAVNIARLTGDALANALMKAETKAKRRVTLSICGLGLLDETEIETIPDARPVQTTQTTSLPPAPPRSAASASRRGTPATQVEDVICNQCGGKNKHLPDCPTFNKKQAVSSETPAKLSVNLYVDDVKMEKTKVVEKDGKKTGGRDYARLSCLDSDSKPMNIFVFHATPMKHVLKWKELWAQMDVTAKEGKDGLIYSLDAVHQVGSVKYQDNEPVIEGDIPTSADLGFDEPQE